MTIHAARIEGKQEESASVVPSKRRLGSTFAPITEINLVQL